MLCDVEISYQVEGMSEFQYENSVTNIIQLVSPQIVDWFSQTKLFYEAPNKGYLYICRMYKSDNKWLRY